MTASSSASRQQALASGGVARRHEPRKTLYERLDAYISRLSSRSPFWRRVCSYIWLPYAFHSGIRMKRLDGNTFMAVLPFRRFNRNWYNAMAGAALLGNTEIAAGFYIFDVCGSDYTVVCKQLSYKFLRPCMGPALYRMKSREEIQPFLDAGKEFNLTLDVDVLQQSREKGKSDRRVGRCEVTFHVTPKAQHMSKAARAEGPERKSQA